jgi:hypothetical protein
MKSVATVLYEDKMQIGSGGAFPPHDFVLAMAQDINGRTVWDLRSLVDKNPRNVVTKLLSDIEYRTRLLAGSGTLCVLVDSDRVARYLPVPNDASQAEVAEALYQCSDAREKLSVHFLEPNLEGLLRSIEECDPTQRAPAAKDHNARDRYLNRAAFALAPHVRDCVKGKQPSLAALVDLLATLCPEAGA